MKKCRKCGVGLISGENANPSQFKNSNYICRPCLSDQNKKQRQGYVNSSDEDKQCRTCNVDLIIGENWTQSRKNNHALICSDCYLERQRKYQEERQNDPVKLRKQREYRLLREYGVSMDEYEKCMATSDSCEICGSAEKLVYDHCHDTMVFRGVLCQGCNTAIGRLGDNIQGVLRAVKYLNNAKLERDT